MSRRSAQWVRAAQWQRSELPLKGYFMWVGSALLVLLVAANWLLPTPAPNPLISSRVSLPPIRIYSEPRAPDEIAADVSSAIIPPQSEDPQAGPSSPDAHSAETTTMQSPPPSRPSETQERRRPASDRRDLNARQAFAQFAPRRPEPTARDPNQAPPTRKKGKS